MIDDVSATTVSYRITGLPAGTFSLILWNETGDGKLTRGKLEVSRGVANFAAPLQAALGAYNPATQPDAALIGQLVGGLNAAQGLNPLYTVPRFAHLPLPPDLVAAAQAGPTGPALARVNRLLLEAAYPVALAAASVASVEAELSLERSTCLGSVFAHRISASESLMAGFARASDIQHGSIRTSPSSCATAAVGTRPRPRRR